MFDFINRRNSQKPNRRISLQYSECFVGSSKTGWRATEQQNFYLFLIKMNVSLSHLEVKKMRHKWLCAVYPNSEPTTKLSQVPMDPYFSLIQYRTQQEALTRYPGGLSVLSLYGNINKLKEE